MQRKKASFTVYLSPLLFFISIAFLGEQMGFYSHPFNRLSGCFFLFMYLLSPNEKNKTANKPYLLSINIFAISLLFIITIIAPLSSISVGFALIITFLRQGKQTSLITHIGSIFFLYLLLHNYFPAFFLLERASADGLNTFLNFITPLDIHFSPYAYGFGYLIMILSFSILSVKEIRLKNSGLFIRLFLPFVSFILYLFLHVLYFSASILYSAMSKPHGFGLDRYFYSFIGSFFPMNGHLIIFILLLFSISVFYTVLQKKQHYTKKHAKKHPGLKTYNGIQISFTLILSFIIIMFFWNINFSSTFKHSLSKPSIYVHNTDMDFEKAPNEEVFGSKNGMFAMFFEYMRDWGFEIQLGVDWEKADPEDNDIIVLINPHGELSQNKKDRFLSFLKEGGQFFVLGDHTFMFGLKNDYFEFTKEMGIGFNFDTAIYFRSLWANCLRSPYTTWNSLINKDGYLTQISQGASLNITMPAVPLIIGQFGWSDAGDLSKESGYLGDRIYSPHEPTGDVILAAERQYGKGKIIVFGDTTFIQNSPISLAYPLIRLCLAHLLPKDRIFLRIFPPALFTCLCLALWIMSSFLIRKIKNIELSEHLLPIQLILFILFIWIGNIMGSGDSFFILPVPAQKERAGIDFTFFNGFFTRDWYAKDRGLGGLKNTIYRSGMLPYFVYQYPKEGRVESDILFLLAPNRKITEKEAKKSQSFIKQGGTLILASGLEHKNQAKELLDLFQLDILNIPLSNLSGKETDLNLRFVSAWPIEIGNSVDVKALCKALEEYPIIIEKILGKGKLVLISDSYFFENRNLESNKSYYRYNSIFVKEMIENNR